MKQIALIFLFFCMIPILFAIECPDAAYRVLANGDGFKFKVKLKSSQHQKLLMKKIGEKYPYLANYPSFQYPNKNYSELYKYFPSQKILIFGYGSLMNRDSAKRSVKAEEVEKMKPAIAFGVKRLFNYQAAKTEHWGKNLDTKEKAMLNLTPSFNLNSMANGVVLEVDEEDLKNLIKREIGYDLVPLLVVDWNDMVNQSSDPRIQIAYTFVASKELREFVDYTNTVYYPVRGYLSAVQEGAAQFGKDFYDLWNATTYLADGSTTIENWDKETFKGILCTKKPQ